MSDCPHCASFAHENAQLTDEVSGLLSLTRRQALSEQALRRELKAARHAEPLARDITAILKLWRAKCSTKRASIELDGKRAAVVRTALKSLVSADPEASPEDQRRQRRRTCMEAVRGLALRPYVVNARRMGQGKPEQRYAKIEHALGDEGRIEDHAAFYRLANAKPSEWAYRAWEAAMQVDTNWFHLWQDAQSRERIAKQREYMRNNPQRVAEVAEEFGITVEQLAVAMVGESPPVEKPRLFVVPNPEERAA